jgi:hypothetical protein
VYATRTKIIIKGFKTFAGRRHSGRLKVERSCSRWADWRVRNVCKGSVSVFTFSKQFFSFSPQPPPCQSIQCVPSRVKNVDGCLSRPTACAHTHTHMRARRVYICYIRIIHPRVHILFRWEWKDKPNGIIYTTDECGTSVESMRAGGIKYVCKVSPWNMVHTLSCPPVVTI